MRHRPLIFLGCLALAFAGQAGAANAPVADEEGALVAVLRGDGGVTEKDGACVRLQRIGTARAVPVLQALLANPELSHAARLALESMPTPDAGRALVAALETTTGAERLGVIGSLTVRREGAAVPVLARLLAGHVRSAAPDDRALAVAAANALGGYGEAGALAALELHWPAAPEPVRGAIVDALLRRAQTLLDCGESTGAVRLAGAIARAESAWPRRVAAFALLLRGSGARAMELLAEALSGPAGPEQAAALQVLPELGGRDVAEVLGRVLPELPAPLQDAVLGGWIQRAEPPGRAVVRPLLESKSLPLQLTAVRALGRSGAAEDAERLVDFAAEPGPLQTAARAALLELRAPGAAARLRSMLLEARVAVRVEAARALGQRGERDAVPDLIALGAGEVAEVRTAAWRAVALAAGEEHVEAMLAAVSRAVESSRREAAGRAVAFTFERLQPADTSAAVQAWVRLAGQGAPAVRMALLPAGGVLAGPRVREVLRAAMTDTHPGVRGAAIRAAAGGHVTGLLSELLRLAIDPAETEYEGLATAACVRWVTQDGRGGAASRRLEVWRALAAAPLRLYQKRLLLQGLATGRTAEELELAERFLADAECWNEAVAAVAGIAGRLPRSVPVVQLLQWLQGCALDPDLRRTVEAAIRTQESRSAAAG